MPRRRKHPVAPKRVEVVDLEECYSCGFETTELTEYERPPFEGMTRKPSKLCDLCASTHAGRAEEDPRNYPGQNALLKTICYVGNVLIAEIRKAKS